MPSQPRPSSARTQIAVIGAGVVGLSIALRLHAAGHEVLLIAPQDDGDGASYGNAGVIADYAVLPVGTPSVLRDLPALLFDRNSPLAIRRAALPSLAPWLLQFARQSLPGAAKRNANAIAALLAEALPEWRSLADQIGGSDLLRARGSLYMYETPAQMRRAASSLAWQRSLGVQPEVISDAELRQLEPGLPDGVAAGAAFFPNTTALADPGAMLARLRHMVQVSGIGHLAASVRSLERGLGGVTLDTQGADGRAQRIVARQVVVAAGAWSRALARAAGDRVPLDTERGYHLEFDMAQAPVIRPMSPVARGFYFSPMQGRLRVAGTVELGGLRAPASPHRLARLESGARAIFPDLPAPSRTWMGFRPSLPDSLPVIGPSRGGNDVIYAFGHGHLGLTLAPITARIVAALVAGKAPHIPLTPYLAQRFGGFLR